jgi:hypothetical protein
VIPHGKSTLATGGTTRYGQDLIDPSHQRYHVHQQRCFDLSFLIFFLRFYSFVISSHFLRLFHLKLPYPSLLSQSSVNFGFNCFYPLPPLEFFHDMARASRWPPNYLSCLVPMAFLFVLSRNRQAIARPMLRWFWKRTKAFKGKIA